LAKSKHQHKMYVIPCNICVEEWGGYLEIWSRRTPTVARRCHTD